MSSAHAMPGCAKRTGIALACLQAYNEKQVQQLTRLIEVTRTDLSKADRQKVRWVACMGAWQQQGAASHALSECQCPGLNRHLPLCR